MNRWQRTLNLRPEWQQAKDGAISMPQLAAVVSTRLASLKPFGDDLVDERCGDLVEEFSELGKREDVSADDFDEVMCSLYDWADGYLGAGKRVCWVEVR